MTEEPVNKKSEVWIVDDDQLTTTFLDHVLNKTHPDIKVRTFYDGISVWKKITSKKSKLPDFILLDLEMPEMDGIELCKKIEKTEKKFGFKIIINSSKPYSNIEWLLNYSFVNQILNEKNNLVEIQKTFLN
ncbi:MAG TPA: PleD family two-component system response regulator [Cyclobacteriaceae bacterium]